jgi:chemotaxis protein MotA
MTKKLVLAAGMLLFIGLLATIVDDAFMVLNLKSGMLVLGGTLLIGCLSFPMKSYKDLSKAIYAVFHYRETDYHGLVKHIERLSNINRRYGNVVLEKEINHIENLFLRKGIELVVDEYDPYEIHNIMEKEYELYFSRKESLVNILNTLQKLAPAIGFVGTIIGLIDVLGNMGDPMVMGRGMAIAMQTTLYGLLFGNFLFLPLSKKLSAHVREEAKLLYIILEGLLDIAKNRNPKAVAYRLQSYLRNYCGVQEYALEPHENKGLLTAHNPFQNMIAKKQNV